MDLFDEEILKPKKKKEIKTSTILIIAIVLLLILCIITSIFIVYIKSTILTIKLDGRDAKDLEEILIMEENNKVYIPIIRMAKYLGYSAYKGDYVTRSEDDPTRCYMESEETVSFTLNSNIITKVAEGQSQQIKITEPIKEINGELCINAEETQDVFNFNFYYDVYKNNITIQTLSFLYDGYSKYAVDKGYLPIEEETFENKKAVLDNMLIVKSENNYFGVISTIKEDEIILETKYDSIEYLGATSEFLVESNNKKGIISKDKKTKIELTYDSIERITNKNDIFYVVKKSNLYGLLDKNGENIIFPEYEQIGIDVSDYAQNGVTNGYILYNQLIPVKNKEKWGLFNIEGKKVTEFVYDSFGCSSKLYRTHGVIEVPDYNLIVGKQGEKYNLITLEGKWLFERFILDSVYITVSEGKNIYHITSGNTERNLIDFLQENGVAKSTPIE